MNALFILASNLGSFLRRLCQPKAVNHRSLRSVQTRIIKMGGRLVRHPRGLVLQLAEVAVAREVGGRRTCFRLRLRFMDAETD